METYGWFKSEFEKVQNSFEYKLEGLELSLTEKILSVMKERGISRSELAKRMDTSKAYISKLFKNGSNMTLKSMLAIAEAIDCSVKVDLIEKSSTYTTEDYNVRQNGIYPQYSADDYWDNEDFKYAANSYS